MTRLGTGLALLTSFAMLAGAGASAQTTSSSPSVEAARSALAAALAAKKADGKTANPALKSALAAYNQVAAARVQELLAEMRSLGNDPAAQSRAVAIRDELLSLGFTPSFSPAPVQQPEVEPNDTPATANFIDTTGGTAIVTGVVASGEWDVFRIQAPAGSSLHAYVDTGASPVNDDSRLFLFAADGTTVIESDDDDGTGNNLDGTVENEVSSSLAGTPLTAGGTYYIGVRGFAFAAIDSYRLLVSVRTAPPARELEPNDTIPSAQILISQLDSGPVPPIGRVGSVSGRLEAGGGDVDVYRIYTQPGNVIFISLDGDPERDTVSADYVVELRTAGGALLLTIDSIGNASSDGAPSEAAAYLAAAGQYIIRVRGGTPSDAGTYTLHVTLAADFSACVKQSLSWQANLNAGTSTFGPPVFFNFAQFSKVVRTGTPGTCAVPKVCPGLQDNNPTAAQFFPLRNSTDQPQCVTVTVSLPSAGSCVSPADQIFVVAYGETFDPTTFQRPCDDYLADLGGSPVTTTPQAFSVTIPPRSWFWLAFYDADSAGGVCNQQVQFTVSGLPTGCESDLAIKKTGPATAVLGPGPVDYTVSVTNQGPMTAPAWQFTDTVPPGHALTGFAPPASGVFGCFVPGGAPVVPPVPAGTVVTCAAAGPFPVGSTQTVTLSYDTTAVVAGCVTDTATLVQPTSPPFFALYLPGFLYTDPNPSNDSSTVTTCYGAAGNIGILKLDSAVSGGGPDPVSAGRDLTYTIRVLNFGPGVAAGVNVFDDLKAVFRLTAPNIGTTVPLRFKAIRKPALGGWTCTTPYPGTIGTVSCQSALLPAGVYDIGLVVTVPPVCPATPPTIVIRNTAVLSGLTDTDPLDNVATQDTTILPKPCFSPI